MRTHTHTQRERERERERETDRQTGKQAGRLTSRQADRQTCSTSIAVPFGQTSMSLQMKSVSLAFDDTSNDAVTLPRMVSGRSIGAVV